MIALTGLIDLAQYGVALEGKLLRYNRNIPDIYSIRARNLRYFSGRKSYYLLAYEIRQTRLAGAI